MSKGGGQILIVNAQKFKESVLLFSKLVRKIALHCQATSVIGAVLICALAPQAQANVWKYVDENGATHFTNQPPGKDAQLVIRSDVSASLTIQVAEFQSSPDAAAHRTVAIMHASPAYQAVQSNLSEASLSHGVDYDLLKAVVAAESAFNPKAVSHKGAVGLMQLMPATARRYGVQAEPGLSISTKLTDPETNISAGTRYLADLLRLFGGQTELAVAAYNAGEGAVMRAGNRIPNYKETQAYVKKVMAVYRVLQIR